jgi:ParB/RepB/Spo0J family partition protein
MKAITRGGLLVRSVNDEAFLPTGVQMNTSSQVISFGKPAKKKGDASSVQSKKPKTHSEQKSAKKSTAPASEKAGQSTSKRFVVPINLIEIKSNRRKLDQEAVLVIKGSMEQLGQLEPIIIRKEKGAEDGSETRILVDGHHRIEAAKLLSLKKIRAVYFQGDEKAARVYELSQNATRAGTTVLDRAKIITELVREVLGKSRAKELERGGHQPGDKGVSKAARELGYTRDDIHRCMVIASMSEKAMAKAVKFDLDNNGSALLKIAKAQPDEQVALVEELGLPRKRKQVKLSMKDKKTYEKLTDAWEDATEWQSAFREATENARRSFISLLQKLRANLAKGKAVWGKGKDTPNEDWDDLEDDQDGEDDDDEDHDGDEENGEE